MVSEINLIQKKKKEDITTICSKNLPSEKTGNFLEYFLLNLCLQKLCVSNLLYQNSNLNLNDFCDI